MNVKTESFEAPATPGPQEAGESDECHAGKPNVAKTERGIRSLQGGGTQGHPAKPRQSNTLHHLG